MNQPPQGPPRYPPPPPQQQHQHQGPPYPAAPQHQGPPHGYQYPQQPPPPAPGIDVGKSVLVGVAVSVLVLLVLGGAVVVYAVLGRGGLARVTDPRPHSVLPAPQEEAVVDEFFTLKDGAQKTWRIPPGRYRVELTATHDGASVAWTGAACQGVKETQIFTGGCVTGQTSQLTIGNPTTFGLGADSTITLKVTRLP